MAATPGDNQETEGKMGGTTGASMLSSLAGMRVFLLFLADLGMQQTEWRCSQEGLVMIGVSIINVTSYTGLELLRLLSLHPEFVLTSVTGRSAAGKRLDEVFPQLHALWMTQNNAQLSVVLRHEAKDVLPSSQSNPQR